jgi:hypothetical protein
MTYLILKLRVLERPFKALRYVGWSFIHHLELTKQTIKANPPLPDLKKKYHRTTLIIVPRSVVSTRLLILRLSSKLTFWQLHQWKAELRTHGKFKKVLIYNNSDTDNNTPRRIVYNEVVLTTYNVIRRSFPNLDNETMERLRNQAGEEERSLAEVIEDWVTEKKKHAGCLHKIHWYRVSIVFLSRGQANSLFRSFLMKP